MDRDAQQLTLKARRLDLIEDAPGTPKQSHGPEKPDKQDFKFLRTGGRVAA